MPRKTVKFAYEGSSKFIKLIFLCGLIPYRIGGFILVLCMSTILPVLFLNFSDDAKALELMATVFSLFLVVVGRSIAAFAQFINWMDRGSVNSKIFKKL